MHSFLYNISAILKSDCQSDPKCKIISFTEIKTCCNSTPVNALSLLNLPI